MLLSLSPLPAFLLSSRKVFAPDERHCSRRADYSVLILMEQGALHFTEEGHPVSLSAGEYYIQRDGLQQSADRPSGGAVYYYIHFSGTYFAEGDGIPLRGGWDAVTISPYIEQLETHYRIHKDTALAMSGLFLQLLDRLRPPTAIEEPIDARLATRIAGHLEAEIGRDLPLSVLAQKYAYSENHIIRCFRRYYGTTPHKYLSRLRIRRACQLLRESDLPITEIALAVGYGEFSTFYRNFQAEIGLSPSDYRKKR